MNEGPEPLEQKSDERPSETTITLILTPDELEVMAGQVAARATRLALSPTEAGHALGVSRDFFDEHVAHELRIVRRGRRKLVPVQELKAWLERNAARPLG